MTKTPTFVAAALAALAVSSPAWADETESAPSSEPATRHFYVGGGFVPHVWIPANNDFSWRFEGELRWTPSMPWSLIANVSYVQVGDAGSAISEDGIGLFAGGMRAWAIGEAATAKFFPHVRGGLAFEATSTRRASSAKHIAFRAGPGIDWDAAGPIRLNLGLEIGFGLLSMKRGSAGDSAVFELTLGLALRVWWGF